MYPVRAIPDHQGYDERKPSGQPHRAPAGHERMNAANHYEQLRAVKSASYQDALVSIQVVLEYIGHKSDIYGQKRQYGEHGMQ